MQTPMKPLFMREGAMHFLENTVVHSMEGVLFASLSTLLTLAGVAMFIENSDGSIGSIGMSASAPLQAAPPAVARRQPEPGARIQQASYVVPASRLDRHRGQRAGESTVAGR